MTDVQRDLTGEHDSDEPEAMAGEPVTYDWDDDPDRQEVDGGDPGSGSGPAA